MPVDVGDPKSAMLVVEEVRRVDGARVAVWLGSSTVAVAVGSSVKKMSESSELAVYVVAAAAVLTEDLVEDLVEEAGEEDALVEAGADEAREVELKGVSLPVSFEQSFVLSLQTYPRSQHKPDRQIGPPLQDAPLHMG